MGVDCIITLPSYTRVRDVAEVIGVAMGMPHELRKFSERDDSGSYCHVEGVRVHPTSEATLAEIKVDGVAVDGNEIRESFWYHFEFDATGQRGIMLRSTALAIVLGRRLVNFLGGMVDYNDSDNTDVDYYCSPQYPDGLPKDGEEWNEYQRKINDVLPLSKEELQEAHEWATYK